jgi:hypothetical protein
MAKDTKTRMWAFRLTEEEDFELRRLAAELSEERSQKISLTDVVKEALKFFGNARSQFRRVGPNGLPMPGYFDSTTGYLKTPYFDHEELVFDFHAEEIEKSRERMKKRDEEESGLTKEQKEKKWNEEKAIRQKEFDEIRGHLKFQIEHAKSWLDQLKEMG